MGNVIIPKIIHYCWFGGNKKPDAVEYCISSWKKYLPDYEIMEWNEQNFAIETANDYVREAYQCKKWAFVSDYVRLYALKQYGGIYFDTDVEVFRSFDALLKNESFFGFESNDYLTTAVMGCSKESPVIQKFIQKYENRHFILENGTMDTDTTNVVVLTKMLKEQGLKLNGRQQTVGSSVIYPQCYFSPNDLRNIFGKYRKENYAYHHCYASWYLDGSPKNFARKVRHYILGKAKNLFGTANIYHLKHPEYIKPLIRK